MAVIDPSYVAVKSLYQPVDTSRNFDLGSGGSDTIDNTRQTYVAQTTTLWNSGKFTAQGQKWASVDGGNPAAGVQNRATPRGIFGIYNHHVTEVEFVLTGNKFDIQISAVANNAWDCTVWIEQGGRMRRLADYPKGRGNTEAAGMRYRNVVIDPGKPFNGRVRVHVAAAIFVGIGHEQNAIIRPAPMRPFGITDGDSFVESGQGQNQSDAGTPDPTYNGYLSMAYVDHLFEATGFAWARRGQGATGFFFNGQGMVDNDNASILNSTRWFSASRKNWMLNAGPAPFDFALPGGQRPIIFLLNGTWNDGAQTYGAAAMRARAKECYQWIQSVDPWCTTVHVSVEPYWGDGSTATGGGAAGTITGPPTAGSKHDEHVQAHIAAAAEVAKTFVINPFGPAAPWWTGKGDVTTKDTTDTASQQAQLTGHDHIHGNWRGYQHYAHRVAREMGELQVPIARAYGHL